MMKKLIFLLILQTVFLSDKLLAQTRYLDNLFTGTIVSSDVVYGTNLSVLSGTPNPYNLKMDVYEPYGDTATNRPVVIVMHTGNFLPAVYNGSPTGTKTDNAVVELCEQFARRGYVAIAMSYRLGWDPLNTVEAIRTGSIINAVYRAVQDAHTCVRYLRMDVTLNGNTFGIDTSKFVIGGIGTGGYVSLGFDAFDDYAELQFLKFIDFTDPFNPVPYIDTALSGDFNGEWARPLNTPSHVGYSNNANMIFNIGGAMGDSSWMAAGDLPIISFHCINDPNAPYHYGAIIVPTTGDFVLDASGSHSVVWNANYLGNNDAFATETYTDCFSVRANSINDGLKGLYPFQTPAPGSMICTDNAGEMEQGSPWDWWDEATYIATANAIGKDGDLENCHALLNNPDMSELKGKAYIDTIVGYLLPRMYKVLFGTFIDGPCFSSQLNISLTSTDVTCNGYNDGQINLSITGSSPPYTFLWSPGGQSTQNLTNLSAGTYSVTVTDSNGISDNATVTIQSPPPVNFILSFTISSNLFTAPPFAVQFNNTTPNPSNYNFTWDFGDGIVIANNNLLVFHEYLFNGTYSITLFAEEIATGCMDTLYQDDYIYCTGGTGCTHSATITQTGPIYSAIGDSVLLSCNTRPTFSYQWKRNGITIPGANDTLYYAKQDGNYTVMIIEYNCPEHSQGIDVYFNVVGLSEKPPKKLTLYPNPTTGILTIEGAEGTVTVYDIYGRLVLTTKTNTLDISHTARGIYFVRVLDEQGTVYSQKVVKD